VLIAGGAVHAAEPAPRQMSLLAPRPAIIEYDTLSSEGDD
jgi:hypothetical protein